MTLPDSAYAVLQAHLLGTLKRLRILGHPRRRFHRDSPHRGRFECQVAARQIVVARELAGFLGYDLSDGSGAGDQTWAQMLALAEERIHAWHGAVAFVLAPQVPRPEPEVARRSVWELLRDPARFRSDDEVRAIEWSTGWPDPRRPALTAAQTAEFQRWQPTTRATTKGS